MTGTEFTHCHPDRDRAYDFLASVLGHVDDGLHVMDERGRISFVNAAGAALLGYASPGELVGLPTHETIHYKRPDGSTFPVGECPHLGVFETGESIRGEDWFVRRDGSMLPVAFSSAPIPLSGAAARSSRFATSASSDVREASASASASSSTACSRASTPGSWPAGPRASCRWSIARPVRCTASL